MSKSKITYLIGAGASKKALPIVRDLPRRLYRYKEDINSLSLRETLHLPKEKIDLYTSTVQWLYEECIEHISIDTFARKLFLRNEPKDYDKLKIVLSDFLSYETLKKGIDKRYDAFFASILTGGPGHDLKLPENINILSWNYDKQIEYSIAKFYKSGNSDDIENFINLYPRHSIGKHTSDVGRFSLLKLNGSVGGFLYPDGYKSELFDLSQLGRHTTEEAEAKRISDNIERLDLRINPIGGTIPKSAIFFSWEKNRINDEIQSKSLEIAEGTDILVIIGYSFPTFNRALDKLILRKMRPSLKRIYLQNKSSNIQNVLQRLKALGIYIKDEDIVLLPQVDEFIIPYEFN